MQTKSPTSVLSILVSYGRSSDFIRLFSTTTVASKRSKKLWPAEGSWEFAIEDYRLRKAGKKFFTCQNRKMWSRSNFCKFRPNQLQGGLSKVNMRSFFDYNCPELPCMFSSCITTKSNPPNLLLQLG